MKARGILRIISLLMLLAAVIFLFCALSCPTLGHTIDIGGFTFGAKQWRIGYLLYVLVMAGLFAASFLVKKK